MKRLSVLCTAAVLALGGCGDGNRTPTANSPTATANSATTTANSATTTANSPTSPKTTGTPRLHVEDNGSTVELPAGDTATITLVDPAVRWGEATVTGTAVTATEEVSDAAAPGRSWRVIAREPGTARIAVVGSPTCRSATPPCATPDREWSVRLRVS